MHTVDSLSGLRKLLSSNRIFHLYSAGFAAGNFMQNLKVCGLQADIKDVLVTNLEGNPQSF